MSRRRRKTIVRATGAFLLVGAAWGQQFEVVSIKPNRGGSDGTTVNTEPGGRFVATNITLRALIESAFEVRDFQVVGGPGWTESDGWDVSAKTADGKDPGRDALKSMLADRFGLKFHREMRELPVYSLMVEKSGARVTPHTGTDGPSGGVLKSGGKATLKAAAVPIGLLAESLSREVGRPVTDSTGLKGLYDLKLEWSADQSGDSASIFTALREQLGLRLEAARGPVEVIVVDAAVRDSGN